MGAIAWLTPIALLALIALPIVAVAEMPASWACPTGAINIEPGAFIQEAVDRGGDGAIFCLRNGVHRMQSIRPRRGQSFHGEGEAVLNGSRLLTTFAPEGRYWVANRQEQRGQRAGECAKDTPACVMPEGVFMDDKPLRHVLSKDSVKEGEFYFDYAGQRLYLVDDPSGHKVEATVAAFAFEGTAPDVLIRNVTVEKYASISQKGAIHARQALNWTIENSEVRLNSGAGIAVGTSSRVRGSNVHHNGQIGITGAGRDVLIENSRIWANNVYGFDFGWEAGGVKLALSDGATFRGNHVHDNVGPGLWCDIDCRNIVYEDNLVERNHDAGIFHEISFRAVIRNNVVRHNGIGGRIWFWGAEILIAASQDVEVLGNTLTVSTGGCGIVLIDQGRPIEGGGKYKTRNNSVHGNVSTFEGAACAGGTSDVAPDDENFATIPNGNNRFDGNVYRTSRASDQSRFVWGHATFDWNRFRELGLETNGQFVFN